MRWPIQSFDTHHANNTKKLILSATPERLECEKAWRFIPNEPYSEGFIRRDYVVVNAMEPSFVIGYGAIWPQRNACFRIDLMVAPDWRRQGIGNALFRRLWSELQVQKATIVQARTQEDRAESLAFLVSRGFIQSNRMAHLRLPVANASTKDWQH